MENREVIIIVANKEIKGFIIETINGYYKIGTHLGIAYRKKELIDKQIDQKV